MSDSSKEHEVDPSLRTAIARAATQRDEQRQLDTEAQLKAQRDKVRARELAAQAFDLARSISKVILDTGMVPDVVSRTWYPQAQSQGKKVKTGRFSSKIVPGPTPPRQMKSAIDYWIVTPLPDGPNVDFGSEDTPDMYNYHWSGGLVLGRRGALFHGSCHHRTAAYNTDWFTVLGGAMLVSDPLTPEDFGMVYEAEKLRADLVSFTVDRGLETAL